LLIKIFIWVFGKKISSTTMAFTSITMAKNTVANFHKARNTDEEYITTKVVLTTMESGSKIEKTDLAQCFISTAIRGIKVTGLMERKMERVLISTKMEISTLETGSRTKRMEKECWRMLVGQFTMESGSTIKQVTREKLSIRTKTNIRAVS